MNILLFLTWQFSLAYCFPLENVIRTRIARQAPEFHPAPFDFSHEDHPYIFPSYSLVYPNDEQDAEDERILLSQLDSQPEQGFRLRELENSPPLPSPRDIPFPERLNIPPPLPLPPATPSPLPEPVSLPPRPQPPFQQHTQPTVKGKPKEPFQIHVHVQLPPNTQQQYNYFPTRPPFQKQYPMPPKSPIPYQPKPDYKGKRPLNRPGKKYRSKKPKVEGDQLPEDANEEDIIVLDEPPPPPPPPPPPFPNPPYPFYFSRFFATIRDKLLFLKLKNWAF